MNIKITADSTCDLSADILKEYNIAITPLTVIKAGTIWTTAFSSSPTPVSATSAMKPLWRPCPPTVTSTRFTKRWPDALSPATAAPALWASFSSGKNKCSREIS